MKIDFKTAYALTINGKTVSKDLETCPVYNPANNEIIAQAPLITRELFEETVAGAKQAFKSWSNLSWDERQVYVNKMVDAIEAHTDELAEILTREQGHVFLTVAKPGIGAINWWMREYAKRRLEVKVVEENDERRVEVHHVPFGVVGLITPWNFPWGLSMWQVSQILMTGNTLILKPSRNTPLTLLRMGEIVNTVLPPGVLSVIAGPAECGDWMTEHPVIRKLSFTGSFEVGQRVAMKCAEGIKRYTLELGGNDPCIVLPDADLDTAVPHIAAMSLGNTGQWCIAAKRIYVHESIFDKFVAKYVDLVKTFKVGDGMDPDTVLGPINNRTQYNKIVDLIDDIKKNGYEIALGGNVDHSLKGNFIPVTVVKNPPSNSRVVREEQFGPVVPILSYKTVEEAIAQANDTEFGLSSSVFGRDTEKCIAVAKQLEAGSVWINSEQYHSIDVPFGGVKLSGFGVENGMIGLEDFCESKTYVIAKK